MEHDIIKAMDEVFDKNDELMILRIDLQHHFEGEPGNFDQIFIDVINPEKYRCRGKKSYYLQISYNRRYKKDTKIGYCLMESSITSSTGYVRKCIEYTDPVKFLKVFDHIKEFKNGEKIFEQFKHVIFMTDIIPHT